jgi:hypothetical protein
MIASAPTRAFLREWNGASNPVNLSPFFNFAPSTLHFSNLLFLLGESLLIEPALFL